MRYSTSIFLLCSFLFTGCATLFNGTTQDVPVRLDEGTTVYDTSGKIYPIYRNSYNDQTIKLKRRNDYPLTFRNGGDSAVVYLQSSMEGAWLIVDYFGSAGIGWIVDGATGAWCSFDGLSVHFRKPSDTSRSRDAAVAGYDPAADPSSMSFRKKTGIIARLGVAFIGPIGGGQAQIVFFGNGFTLGLGYKLFQDLQLYADYTTVSYLDSHPRYSRYYSNSSLKAYEAGFRFFPTSGIYITAGLGYGHVTTDSVYYYPNDYSTINLVPSQGHLGTAVFGVGHAGSIGFLELQARWGTNGFSLSSGERGRLYSIGLHYGLNLAF